MGSTAGAFECNSESTCDATMHDVPDPSDAVLDCLAAALKPAYIEVVRSHDTGQDTPNVPFSYHVAYGSIADQASLRRGAVSTEGRWIGYIQGAYEGDPGRDNDPDGEEGSAGGITSQAGRSSSLIFFETTRDHSQMENSDTRYGHVIAACHEFGHQFGISHGGDNPSDCGLMKQEFPIVFPMYCPEDIFRIRQTIRPSHP